MNFQFSILNSPLSFHYELLSLGSESGKAAQAGLSAERPPEAARPLV